MVYNEYRTYILTCEYLGREPTGQYKKIHDFLTGLWDGTEVVVDLKKNKISLQKEKEWFFEQDQRNGYMWCNYDRVWSFLQDDMCMEVSVTQDFIKSTVEEHLKCKVGTPSLAIGRAGRRVEEHLKCKVGTPLPIRMEDEL